MIRRLFEELWGTGTVSAADRFYAPGPARRREAIRHRPNAAIPDWRVTIDELVAEDDGVVVRWTGTGTSLVSWDGVSPTGRPVTSTGIDIERIVDGMIVEENGEVDMLGFLRQIDGGSDIRDSRVS